MDVRINVEGDHDDQLHELATWLEDEQELRGQVKLERARPSDNELGAVTDAVVVAFGAGGAGTVLASSLVTWIKARRSTVRLTIRTPERTVDLELATIDDVAPVLKQVLDAVTDD